MFFDSFQPGKYNDQVFLVSLFVSPWYSWLNIGGTCSCFSLLALFRFFVIAGNVSQTEKVFLPLWRSFVLLSWLEASELREPEGIREAQTLYSGNMLLHRKTSRIYYPLCFCGMGVFGYSTQVTNGLISLFPAFSILAVNRFWGSMVNIEFYFDFVFSFIPSSDIF